MSLILPRSRDVPPRTDSETVSVICARYCGPMSVSTAAVTENTVPRMMSRLYFPM